MKIAISDFGIGIPAEVRKVANPASDFHALQMATEDGFSSKPGKNMGAGLSYIIDNVVKRYKGWVGIYSGGGYITFNHVFGIGTGGVGQGLYPGTLVSMILPATHLISDDEEAEAPW